MNHKQKLGYTLLGAGIMAVGMIIGQWGTPDIEAQNNGVFDIIQCRKLQVVDENGNQAIFLSSSDQHGNALAIFDKQGNVAIDLVSDQEGNGVWVTDKQTSKITKLEDR